MMRTKKKTNNKTKRRGCEEEERRCLCQGEWTRRSEEKFRHWTMREEGVEDVEVLRDFCVVFQQEDERRSVALLGGGS